MGPGCMTMASGLASCSFSGVRPKLLKNSWLLGSSAPLMRSFCSRSMMTTSQPLMPSSSVWHTRTPICAMSPGTRVLGPTTRTSGTAQRGQRVDVGARHARVQHVAHDGHGEVAEVLLVVPDGVHVQQPLRGVGVAAVAGVDHMHMRRHMLGNQVGRAAFAVAHHEQVGVPSRSGWRWCRAGFALGRRAARDVEVDHVGAQARGGNLEGGAGAGAVLEEQVEHALAAQQRHLLHLAVVDADKIGGGVQDVRDDVFRQAFNGQQVDQFTVLVELGLRLYSMVRCPRPCFPPGS
jgi:hypothetical protein